MLRPMRVLLLILGASVWMARAAAGGCPASDVLEDCEVNFLDLRELALRWLDPECMAPSCRADLDGVPGVDGADFALLADEWGARGVVTLVINEFMADNDRTIEDPDESGDFPDWIELYNYGDDPIDIGGMYIADDSTRWQIPGGQPEKTTILPGGFLLLWADGDEEQGPLHLPFGLGKSGDMISLFDRYQNRIDVYSFGAQAEDVSMGRLPDGSDNWVSFGIGSTTPGRSNRSDAVEVVINEIMYHPFHDFEPYAPATRPEPNGLEYIELYNKGSRAVNLQGWRFTDGVDCNIPPYVLAPGQYVVIAADTNAFSTRYPDVTNVVGGWSGRLSNSGETVELVDEAGVIVDTVRYADQGEWAQRYLGPLDAEGRPAPDFGHLGWMWSDDHDGLGKSLELINPALSNDYGQNWGASSIDGGTPGAVNSIAAGDLAPLILDVQHAPIIPRPADAVAVTARIVDELASGFEVRLHYRLDKSSYSNGQEDIYPRFDPNDYNDLPMFDDGEHRDGAAGDGLYGAVIPAMPDGAIIEFYVEAVDAGGNSRTWPPPSLMDGEPEQVTNALYQVDGSFETDAWTAGSQPIYYMIMTENEKGRLRDIGDGAGGEHNSDAQMNATFISVDGVDIQVRYRVGVRNRGHGSRRPPPNNYRVRFPSDRPWNGVTRININARNTFVQVAGSAVFTLSGLPVAEATAVQARLNGENMLAGYDRWGYGSYAYLEVVDSDFAANHFPDDRDGNAYKCMRDDGPADLEYRGPDPDDYRNSYFKDTNVSADDWRRLIELCYVLDRTPDSNYVREVKRVINVDKWLLYFALNALLDNNETSLCNGYGDDYYLYHGLIDPRFVVIAHDLDSIFGYNGSSATRGIWRAAGLPVIRRFLQHPEFAPRYYGTIKHLIETTLSPGQIGPLLDELLGDFAPQTVIDGMKDFVARRNAHVLSLIPSQLTINSPLPVVDGYHYTTSRTYALSGTADAVETRSVTVNGQLAQWSPVNGTWDFGGAGGTSETIVARGSVWKYLDDGSDGGTAADGLNWFAHPDYNDSGWAEGPAELGYGDDRQGRPENTVVGYIDIDPCTPGDQPNVTTYFRRTFDVNDPSRYMQLQLGLMRDDGAVVYLNGIEVARSSTMPAGPIDYMTRAIQGVGGAGEYTFYEFALEPDRLNAGRNVLAVEVHQAGANSRDMSFDLELTGTAPPEGAGALNPGINRVIVQTFDGFNGAGTELERDYIDIWYDTGYTNDYPKSGGAAPPARYAAAIDSLRANVIVRDSYLPGVPVLVRVELLNDQGQVERGLWDAVAVLSVNDNPGISLSTDRVVLYNGLGTALVTFTGSGDFTLTVNVKGMEVNKTLADWSTEPINTVSGSLAASTTWSGIYHITGGDFTIPDGLTLTLDAGTLVLVDGVTSGENGPDIDVAGAIRSNGTADSPVTITAFAPGENWGEIDFRDAEPSSFEYTNINSAGRSPRVGHSNSGPTVRCSGSSITFDHACLTDNAGKLMHVTSGSDLTFGDCVFARCIMGPEISGTALRLENTWITEMHAGDDADGIYIHGQQAGQVCTITGGVVADFYDDGVDTLGSEVTVEDLIIRNGKDKGVSVYGGETTLRRCLIVENNAAPEDPTVATIAAKTLEGRTAVVNIDRSTIVTSKVAGSTDIGIQAHNKYGVSSGRIIFNVTSSIIDATNPIDVQAPYLESDVHISYSDNFAEVWPGTGNIVADPQFVDASGHDYRLRGGSPCIDAGDPAAELDPDGTVADQGYYWFDQNTPELPENALREDTVWTPLDGPYRLTDELVVPEGVTLTILPGTTVFFEPDAKLTVNGRLVAEGTMYQLIRFTRTASPSPAGSRDWGGLQFVGTTADNRVRYAVIEYGSNPDGMVGLAGANLLLEHATLDHVLERRIETVDSSLVVRNCVFTDTVTPGQSPLDNRTEHIWGRGVPAWGRFIIENNLFGRTPGHNDAIDLDGPERPRPIPQILNNTFTGGGDDALDLETDAHIEGNVFMHYRKDEYNTDPGRSNAISAGSGKDFVVVRNVFYDVDNVSLVKEDSFLVFENNTVFGAVQSGLYFDLPGQTGGPGAGARVAGCIFADTPKVFDYMTLGTTLSVDYSILPRAWHYLGRGNFEADPLFVDANSGDLRLRPNSPAVGTGPCGLDMGAYVRPGAALCGEPGPVTYRTTAALTVGGPGITHYKYSVNAPAGPWSGEFPVDEPIELSALAEGQTYTVYVLGQNSAGVWQEPNEPTASRTWTVDTSYSQLRINEVLAHTHGADPDIIELYYDGPAPIDLTGMSLTDNRLEPRKFVFDASTVTSTTMNPGDYMVLYGDLLPAKNHIGFGLLAEGESLYLYDKDGTTLIDSVEFGQQINLFSIGRIGYDGSWKLTRPTFGLPNQVQPLGNPDTLAINEWLANGQVLFDEDFIEIYNPQPYPVSLSGLFLTDNPVMQPEKHQIVPLSFIAPQGYAVFRANDGNEPSEVGFKLSADGEVIALLNGDLDPIDQLIYRPQTTDISQGRSPDGSAEFEFFWLPTPGVANEIGPKTITTSVVLAAEDADKRAIVPLNADHVADTWNSEADFDDSDWAPCSGGPGGVGYEAGTGYEGLITLDVGPQMYNLNTSCYVRIPFTADGAELADFTGLTLRVRYDDGYVAYINGVEVDRRLFTGVPQWDSRAAGSHEAAGSVFDVAVDISDHLADLRAGENLLAIHALNRSPDSSDFLISAELEASITTIEPGGFPYEEAVDLLNGLRITELMYNAPQGANYDYIELQNILGKTLNLSGVRFVDGVEFVFPEMVLAPGQCVVVVSNVVAFRSVYGFGVNVAGQYAGGLSGGGEQIVLQLPWPLEAAVMRFEYSDKWYPTTDGAGDALAVVDASVHPAAWNDPQTWQAASPSPGTP